MLVVMAQLTQTAQVRILHILLVAVEVMNVQKPRVTDQPNAAFLTSIIPPLPNTFRYLLPFSRIAAWQYIQLGLPRCSPQPRILFGKLRQAPSHQFKEFLSVKVIQNEPLLVAGHLVPKSLIFDVAKAILARIQLGFTFLCSPPAIADINKIAVGLPVGDSISFEMALSLHALKRRTDCKMHPPAVLWIKVDTKKRMISNVRKYRLSVSDEQATRME
jgi:hypothetical protein